MVTKQNAHFFKIILIIITHLCCISLHSSENDKKDSPQKEYTLLNLDLVPFLSTRLFSYGAVVEKTLTSLGDNNKIFVCYTGHKNKTSYTIGGNGYIDKYCYGNKTNVFTEIDTNNAIEHTFYPFKETDNEKPVTAIARHKDLYFIAHENNVYICNKQTGFLRDSLYKKQRFLCQIQENSDTNQTNTDIVKKIFIDKKNKLIIVSKNGAIFYHDINATDSTIKPFCTLDDSYSAITYNNLKNTLLFGMKQNFHIIDFNKQAPLRYCIQIAPHCFFNIKIIDSSDSHILLSDITSHKKEKHEKDKDCCQLNLTPYDLRPNCTQCEQAMQQFETKEITVTGTPIEIHQNLTNLKPLPCSHKDVPQNLPYSCFQQTIMVIAWDDQIKHLKNPFHAIDKSVYIFQDMKSHGYHKKCIKHILLDNNNTLLTQTKKGTAGCSGFESRIYPFNLADLSSDKLRTTLSGYWHDIHPVRPKNKKIHWIKTDSGLLLIYTQSERLRGKKLHSRAIDIAFLSTGIPQKKSIFTCSKKILFLFINSISLFTYHTSDCIVWIAKPLKLHYILCICVGIGTIYALYQKL
jgi:hypothetical protein